MTKDKNRTDKTHLNVSTEEEARAQANIIRKNTVDFQMATMLGDGTSKYPPLPMIVIDKNHYYKAFVKRTPWIPAGQYGTRYSVQWGTGIPAGHLTLHTIFSNDETGERKEFWLVICPLQMHVLKQQGEAFTAITRMIRQTYGEAERDTPIAIISEQAWGRLNGHTIESITNTLEGQRWLEDNMVMVKACDFRIYCRYFEILWAVWSRLPVTQGLVDYVSHFPCRYCELSRQFLRSQNRILTYAETTKMLDENPALRKAFQDIYDQTVDEMEDKVLERSKEMEKGEY